MYCFMFQVQVHQVQQPLQDLLVRFAFPLFQNQKNNPNNCIFSVCENDWISYAPTGGCYKYFPTWLAWEDARRYCQQNVPYNIGDLASIPDAGTNGFLQNLIQDAYIWVGGFRDENSTWRWSDGTQWGYTHWFDHQPNNLDGLQSHVAFNFQTSGQWNDEHVEEEHSFICHYKGKDMKSKIKTTIIRD